MNTIKHIVNKYGLKPGKEYIVEIPNMVRDNLGDLFNELGFTMGAEIGVERGVFSAVLTKANPSLQLFAIDPYSPSAYEPGIDGIDYTRSHFSQTYREAKKVLSKQNVKFITKESMSAIKSFKDNTLDFVYIDGNHSFVNVSNDLHEWSKKVKVGGIIAGHDFAYFPAGKQNHVKHAVLAYTRAYGIKPLFVVGASEKKPGIPRDTFRSWFWVKTA